MTGAPDAVDIRGRGGIGGVGLHRHTFEQAVDEGCAGFAPVPARTLPA